MGGANSIGASVSAAQYAKDLLKLREMVDRLYENSQQKPMIVAPGAFFDDKWYHELVTKTGPNVVTALTHHIYNMGAGIYIYMCVCKCIEIVLISFNNLLLPTLLTYIYIYICYYSV